MNEKDKDICDVRQERDDLAMLVRRLAYQVLRDGKSAKSVAEKAQNYLKRKKLNGNVLRDHQSTEPGKG